MEQNVRDPYDFCRPYLLEDEYILWKGRPERGNIFRQGDWMVVIFAVMWLGFSLFWEFSALQSVMSGGGSLFLALWGLPFVAIGLYLLFGRFLQTAYLRDKTFYVITNKKIMVKSGRKITMRDGKDLPPMDVMIHRNGNGTILFSETYYTRRGSHRTYFMLENLKDVARAQNAVSQMERA